MILQIIRAFAFKQFFVTRKYFLLLKENLIKKTNKEIEENVFRILETVLHLRNCLYFNHRI